MNETQRAAAERLAFEQWYDAQLEGRINPWDVWQAAALLRELLADPQGEPVAWYYIEDPWGANEWHWMTDSPESQNCDPSDWTPVYAAPQQRQPVAYQELAEQCARYALRIMELEKAIGECTGALESVGHPIEWVQRKPLNKMHACDDPLCAVCGHGITGEPT